VAHPHQEFPIVLPRIMYHYKIAYIVLLYLGLPKRRNSENSRLIGVRKLSELGHIWGHYTGQTDLKLNSLSFLTLITKLQSRSAFGVASHANVLRGLSRLRDEPVRTCAWEATFGVGFPDSGS